MNQIVSDLMMLSELEEKKREEVEFKPIDFPEIVENILKIYREKIKKKNLRLDVNIDSNLPVFKGEKFKPPHRISCFAQIQSSNYRKLSCCYE